MAGPTQDVTVTVRGKKISKRLPASYSDAQVRAAFRDIMRGYGIDSSEQAVINQPMAPRSPSPRPQAPEDYWRARLGDQGSISATPKTLGGVLQNAVTSGLGKAGLNDRQAQHYGERVFGALNDLTPVGNATGAEQGGRDFLSGVTRGDLKQAAMGAGIFALSAMPGVVGRGVKHAGGRVLKDLLADEAGTFGGRKAATAPYRATDSDAWIHYGNEGDIRDFQGRRQRLQRFNLADLTEGEGFLPGAEVPGRSAQYAALDTPFPPIDVMKLDADPELGLAEALSVYDGAHRVRAARMRGEDSILGWIDDPQGMAEDVGPARGKIFADLAGAPAVIRNDPAQDILAAAAEGGQSFANWRAANEGKIGSMFDYSRLDEVPDVPQVPMERYQPPRGPSGRILEALANPEVVEGINSAVRRGAESGAGLPWYNTEPLREAALAAGVDNAGYGRLMDNVAATSPRSKVTDNTRTGSYYHYLRENGIPIPDKPAPGYGSLAQGLHTRNVRNLEANGGWSIFQNPKPASFSSNLQGNQANATIDTHNFRLPGILSRDPRFLETSIQELVKGGPQAAMDTLKRQYPDLPDEVIAASVKAKGDKGVITYRPQEWVNKGYISMDTAANDPALWAAKPKDNEYGFYEDFQRREAEKMGITPAQYQASMWVGAGADTGLGSLPEPFLKTVEARIRYTADRMGLDPAVVRDRFLKGSAPLLGIGGTVLILRDGQIVEEPGAGEERPAA